MKSFRFGIGELRPGEWISFRSEGWGSINLDPFSGKTIPVSTHVTIGGSSYSAYTQPLQLPERGTQPGVLNTSPRPGVEAYKLPGPQEGYTYDPVTQTSTWTIVGGGPCSAPHRVTWPCIQRAGSWASATEGPSPPPLPPSPPVWPPGFFNPSPYPPTPAAPPDGLRFWSLLASWGGRLPQRGDVVEIPEGITIVMDISPPFLWRLNVKGTLVVYNIAGADLKLRCVFLHIWPGGTFTAGSPGDSLRRKLKIEMVGDTLADPRDFCGKIGKFKVGPKSICVEGRLFLHGREPDRAWTHLNATVQPGAGELVLTEQVNWRANETVAVVTTDYDQAHTEKVVIGEVAHRSGTSYGSPTILRKLQTPLTHKHYAATERHGSFDVELRAEVALISRNVEIESVDMFDEDYFFHPQTKETDYGFKMRVLDGGEANLVAVRFVKGGYYKSPREYIPTLTLESFGSVVKKCVFDETFAQPIRISARNVRIDSNVVANSVLSGIRISSPGAIVTGNLVLEAKCMSDCAG